jgi:hypothetical protein
MNHALIKIDEHQTISNFYGRFSRILPARRLPAAYRPLPVAQPTQIKIVYIMSQDTDISGPVGPLSWKHWTPRSLTTCLDKY